MTIRRLEEMSRRGDVEEARPDERGETCKESIMYKRRDM